jgi:mono/diheme cytochrome c family protein
MKKVLLILFVLAALGLAACGSGEVAGSVETSATLAPVPAEYSGKTNPLGTESANAGALVFENNCVACHGAQGHGDGPAGASLDPAPKNLAELSAVATDDYLFWRISTGKEGTAMVAWKGVLSDEQIWQVISFIHTLK